MTVVHSLLRTDIILWKATAGCRKNCYTGSGVRTIVVEDFGDEVRAM